jgi:hypothetical protein
VVEISVLEALIQPVFGRRLLAEHAPREAHLQPQLTLRVDAVVDHRREHRQHRALAGDRPVGGDRCLHGTVGAGADGVRAQQRHELLLRRDRGAGARCLRNTGSR